MSNDLIAACQRNRLACKLIGKRMLKILWNMKPNLQIRGGNSGVSTGLGKFGENACNLLAPENETVAFTFPFLVVVFRLCRSPQM